MHSQHRSRRYYTHGPNVQGAVAARSPAPRRLPGRSEAPCPQARISPAGVPAPPSGRPSQAPGEGLSSTPSPSQKPYTVLPVIQRMLLRFLQSTLKTKPIIVSLLKKEADWDPAARGGWNWVLLESSAARGRVRGNQQPHRTLLLHGAGSRSFALWIALCGLRNHKLRKK